MTCAIARSPKVLRRHLIFKLAEKSATGKVERRWLRLFVAAMGALAIFAPARRLLRYALDFMHRKPLTIDAWQGFRTSGFDESGMENGVAPKRCRKGMRPARLRVHCRDADLHLRNHRPRQTGLYLRG